MKRSRYGANSSGILQAAELYLYTFEEQYSRSFSHKNDFLYQDNLIYANKPFFTSKTNLHQRCTTTLVANC